MTSHLIQLIRSRCQLLEPKPTGVTPRLQRLTGIRSVLFDIYGTLIISGSGDIGLGSGEHRVHALADVARTSGVQLKFDAADVIAQFQQQIQDDHEASRNSGVAYPEIEIRDVWARVLKKTALGDVDAIDFAAFSLEYELRVNPTWPMPNVEATLNEIANLGMVKGIVSNAQFFTPLLFPALLNRNLDDWGFAQNLSYFSYENKQAKPGAYLYETAKRDLVEMGISANEVLYVGNDMLNDVAAAQSVGFRTALFAGDQRSLRLRSDDDRVHGVEADIVVTELPQLIECLPIN